MSVFEFLMTLLMKRQHLTHVGVLTDLKKQFILSKIDEPRDPGQVGVGQRETYENQRGAYRNFTELLEIIAQESQPQPRAFFDNPIETLINFF